MSGTDTLRDLGYFAWTNDLSWMEESRSDRWKQVIKSENEKFSKALRRVSMKTVRPAIRQETGINQTIGQWTLEPIPFSNTTIWTNIKTRVSIKCWDADFDHESGYFAAAIQDPEGFERFQISIYDKHIVFDVRQ